MVLGNLNAQSMDRIIKRGWFDGGPGSSMINKIRNH